MIQHQELSFCRSRGGMFSRADWGFVNMPEERHQAMASWQVVLRWF